MHKGHAAYIAIFAMIGVVGYASVAPEGIGQTTFKASVRLMVEGEQPVIINVSSPLPLADVVDFAEFADKKVAVMECYSDNTFLMPVSNCFRKLSDHENYVIRDGDALSVYVI